MKNLITWFSHPGDAPRGASAGGNCPVSARWCAEGASAWLQGPITQDSARRYNSSESAVLGVPVRDIGLWALCPGGENFGECDRGIVPPGRLDEKDSGDHRLSRNRTALAALVSRMAKELGDQVQAIFLRPIEQAIPYLFVDAYTTTKFGTEHGTSLRRSWWSPGCGMMITGVSSGRGG